MGRSSNMGELDALTVYPDTRQLARAVADQVVALAGETIKTHGQFAVVLAGGSTPKAAYALLGTEEYATQVDWSRVQVFWGDERCVPPDHPDSNYRMARQAWLNQVSLPAQNVHRIKGELEPDQAAREYEDALRTFFALPYRDRKAEHNAPVPSFDLILLGMGDDGHTASLFPGTAAIHEQTRWVVAHFVEKLDTWRITLTPPVINAAPNVTFVVSGSGKAERLRQVLKGPYQPDVLPAQIIKPHGGQLRWLLDQAAAGSLPAKDL